MTALACARTLPVLLTALLLGACATPPAPADGARGGPAAAPVPSVAREDDRRPEQPTTITLWGQPVALGGSWDYSDERRSNFDLRSDRARNRRVREHELKLEARGAPRTAQQWMLQAVALRESRRTQGTAGVQRSQALERGQMWWRAEGVAGWAPLSLQIGRQPLVDRRAWWWDDDLDALRLVWQAPTWRLDTGLARELLRVTSADPEVAPAQRGVTRWFGHARHDWQPRHALEAFWLWQHDGSGVPADAASDPSDFNARWLGLRASGQWRWGSSGMRLAYRADLATLRGRETLAADASRQRVAGSGLDLGASLTLGLPLRPTLSLGYARGSTGFRQTGLHENKARVGGVKRVPLYGALLAPELGNLAVASAGLGLRWLENSSLELLWHRHRQLQAATRVRDARLSANPLGLQRALGHELDLVLALREWQHLELLLVWSRFRPGVAYGPAQQDPAHSLELGITVNF